MYWSDQHQMRHIDFLLYWGMAQDHLFDEWKLIYLFFQLGFCEGRLDDLRPTQFCHQVYHTDSAKPLLAQLRLNLLQDGRRFDQHYKACVLAHHLLIFLVPQRLNS